MCDVRMSIFFATENFVHTRIDMLRNLVFKSSVGIGTNMKDSLIRKRYGDLNSFTWQPRPPLTQID